MDAPFKPLRIAVLTVSDTRTLENDGSGQVLAEGISAAGHLLAAREILRDDLNAIRSRVAAWIDDKGVDVVLTTGGTGVTGRDGTPEAIAPLLEKTIEGFGELFRQLSYAEIGASTIQSRCLAGVAKATFIFCLPGSSGACRLGWEKILQPQLDSRTKPCNFAELIPRLRER
jgi:molybdenum cofactor biosynthesis protein B